jgi:hypothetical protein
MSRLASDSHKFLQELLDASGKKQDELLATWNDDDAEVYPHEGHVLLIGKPGSQRLMHCITYETISLPSLCVVHSQCSV